MCYVGKATKIFIFIVAVLVVVGFVLGFSIMGLRNLKAHKCSDDYCRKPISSDPVPTTTTSTTAPAYSPPSPPAAESQGPVHA
ncbi:hypothetical protein BVC80_8997g42 [Macleaya cordata]|uniref:Transmembrane protein n=1 Tax=Macleaya cordata TaxID=56857 RepID=A0A200QMH0_MACCD|nr:hypothetical protein BVC80_8997g42 [Macleaya cordata]